MMLIKQLSVFLENRPGSLAEACRALRTAGLNIRTLSLADTDQFGILRLLVRETEKAQAVLTEAGFAVKTTEVFALQVPNRPGGLADILEIVDRHGLSVEYMYAFPGSGDEQAVIVFRFNRPEQVLEELKSEPVVFVKPEELFG